MLKLYLHTCTLHAMNVQCTYVYNLLTYLLVPYVWEYFVPYIFQPYVYHEVTTHTFVVQGRVLATRTRNIMFLTYDHMFNQWYQLESLLAIPVHWMNQHCHHMFLVMGAKTHPRLTLCTRMAQLGFRQIGLQFRGNKSICWHSPPCSPLLFFFFYVCIFFFFLFSFFNLSFRVGGGL